MGNDAVESQKLERTCLFCPDGNPSEIEWKERYSTCTDKDCRCRTCQNTNNRKKAKRSSAYEYNPQALALAKVGPPPKPQRHGGIFGFLEADSQLSGTPSGTLIQAGEPEALAQKPAVVDLRAPPPPPLPKDPVPKAGDWNNPAQWNAWDAVGSEPLQLPYYGETEVLHRPNALAPTFHNAQSGYGRNYRSLYRLGAASRLRPSRR